jgi:hypothetical protein
LDRVRVLTESGISEVWILLKRAGEKRVHEEEEERARVRSVAKLRLAVIYAIAA